MTELPRFVALEPEMRQAQLGDRRLDRRLVTATSRLADDPAKSFPQVFEDDAAGLEALYRLVNNRKVTLSKVLKPHVRATVARCAEEKTVLAIHDTTSLAFSSEHEREGLGPVEGGTQGLYLHTTLMASTSAHYRPLGVVAMKAWAREPIPDSLRGNAKRQERAKLRRDSPDKESLRWKEQIEEVRKAVDGLAEVIHVGDSETDDYDLLATLVGKRDRFVLRQKHDRKLVALHRPQEGGAVVGLDGPASQKLLDAVAAAKTVVEREVEVAPRQASKDLPPKARANHPPRKRRKVKLELGSLAVRLLRPDHTSRTLPESLELNIVFATEKDCPEGEDPVQWILYTTEPVDTAAQVERVVDIYRGRWLVEMYFDALKNGCALAKRQLESLHALTVAIGIFTPIAWRLLLMRALEEATPETPATAVLSARQLDVLRASLKKTKLAEAPTTREVVWAVAALGGHLKHNGRPGWRTLGRGYEKLLILEEGWRRAERAGRACPACGHQTPG